MGVAARREREKLERREAIVMAAEEVFRRRGLTDATMDEIAEAAEVSKGTLYLYFSGKDALMVELLDRYTKGALEELSAAADGADSGFSQIQRISRAMATFALTHPQKFLLGTWWLMPGSTDLDMEICGAYRERVGEIFALFTHAILRGQNDGSIRRDIDPRRTAIQLWSALRGVLLMDINKDRLGKRLAQTDSILPLADNFIEIFLQALKLHQPCGCAS